MIETVAITFVVFVLAAVGMAIGTIMTGRHLTGSCGGLSAIDGAGRCTICGRDKRDETQAAAMSCDAPPAEDRARS